MLRGRSYASLRLLKATDDVLWTLRAVPQLARAQNPGLVVSCAALTLPGASGVHSPVVAAGARAGVALGGALDFGQAAGGESSDESSESKDDVGYCDHQLSCPLLYEFWAWCAMVLAILFSVAESPVMLVPPSLT